MLVQSEDELAEPVTMRQLRPVPSADSSPLTVRRSKEETLALFDGIISQIEDAGGLVARNRASAVSNQVCGWG